MRFRSYKLSALVTKIRNYNYNRKLATGTFWGRFISS
jgi:hypothetical protein